MDMTKGTKIIKLKGRLNSENESLTPEKLKSYKGCENLTDDQATETVFALQTFASILYEIMTESETNQLKTAA
jgi:hypothetical protein